MGPTPDRTRGAAEDLQEVPPPCIRALTPSESEFGVSNKLDLDPHT